MREVGYSAPAKVDRQRRPWDGPSLSARATSREVTCIDGRFTASRLVRRDVPTLIGASTSWHVGLVLGIVVVAVAAVIVILVVTLAYMIAKRARTAVQGVDKVREQTDALAGVAQINDSGVRILHSARALRKVAVGK